jgi:tetratricopeptide (TPR) repeat protein
MSQVGAADSVLARAHDAAARAEWQVAFDLFQEAAASGDVGVADLPVLANVAYGSGHLDVTIETWERAYAELTAAGDSLAAAGAAVRVAMHLLFDTSLMAPVRGWLARAEQLLDDDGETPVHAWFAVVRSYERMLSGDPQGARPWARRAIEVGSRWDAAAAAIGRVAEARLVILDGEVDRGLALLDEAGIAAISGDLDPLSTGVVYCELVCALQGLAQYDLAEQWTEAMERWADAHAIGSLRGRCRVHRAEIMRLRGRCHEAELEALRACDELRPYLHRELGWPLSELGRIRLHLGDVAGAEQAFLAAHQAGWDPQPGLAKVLLSQGALAAAAASITEALDNPSWAPFKELPPSTDLRRAPLLDAKIEIGVAAGDLTGAHAACEELENVATRFQSKVLAACAAQGRARLQLADGQASDAQRLFAQAARLWNEVGAPYETAVARLGLADAYRAVGADHRSELERLAASAVLDRIAAGADPGAEAPSPAAAAVADDRTTAHNTFRREGDYWSVTFQGHTTQVRDRKGMRHLARLLASPGREFHVLDLVAAEAGNPVPGEEDAAAAHLAFGDAGALLDATAKQAYRRRLAEIDDDIDNARSAGDNVREAQADAEREFLIAELSRAVGLGGRDRRAGSASERARAGVTRAVRQAIARINQYHPDLGQHLERAIRTGTYCSYLPDTRGPSHWDL